jgi:hypothetical protein
MLRAFSQWVETTHYPAIPIVLGVTLTLPSLCVGLQSDDYFIRSVVTAQGTVEPELALGRLEAYTFLDGDETRNHALVESGWMPWWTDTQCSAAMWRPLSALTFVVDYALWPNHPALMHAHSLLWFAALIGVAAVFYRQVLGSIPIGWCAALAAVLFAIDDTHATPASWLANRNALIAGMFGIGTLLAHHAWRSRSWSAGVVCGPILLLLAVLGKEEAVAVGGYLVAYVLFMDRSSLWRRWLAVMPYAGVGVVWLALYKAGEFGAYASGGYVDPVSEPLRFLQHAGHNGPLLLMAQWIGLPSDINGLLSATLAAGHWILAVVVLVGLVYLLRPVLHQHPVARFFAVGMVAALLPVSSGWVADRLLLFVGFGAMPLLALWLVGTHVPAAGFSSALYDSRLIRIMRPLLMTVHVVLAPLMLGVGSFSMRIAGDMMDQLYDTLPAEAALEDQTLVLVNSPSCLYDLNWIHKRIHRGQPLPQRSLNLSPSCTRADIERLDAFTIAVRPAGGYFRPRGWCPEPPIPLVAWGHAARQLDTLVRARHRPMQLGDIVEREDVHIAITQLTRDGRPAEATFRFTQPLNSPALRWVELTDTGYRPFELPAVGQVASVVEPMQ